MQKNEKGLSRISLAVVGHILITLEIHGIYWSNFAYLYI